MSREEVLRHPAYWFENEQNEIYSQVSEYMDREGINQTQLAERLKVGKSYVSQILKGNCNFSLKKWIELCLAIGIVPGEYRKLEDVIRADAEFSASKKASENKTKSAIEPSHYFKPYSLGDNARNYIDNDSKTMPNEYQISTYSPTKVIIAA
jgi:transcriptional regulator with XRE-family HTH domain